MLFPANIEDALIENLKTYNLLMCMGAVFKHVELKGRIGKIMIRDQEGFEGAYLDYYRTVDWALDISKAEFQELDLRSVPAKLVIRDPETQVVVKRYKAEEGLWKQLPLSHTWWPVSLQWFVKRKECDDVVLVAPKRHPRFKELLGGLQLLRREGIAEPD